MAKYDLDDSHSDMKARHANRIALAGTIFTLALVVWGGYMQSHPWQTTGQHMASTWFADVAYNGKTYRPTGKMTQLHDSQMQVVGKTDDGRAVCTPKGGGGGGGTGPLYVKLDLNYYLPITPR